MLKFLALLEAPYIYDISRLRVKYVLNASLNFVFSFLSIVGLHGKLLKTLAPT